eukprot:2355119-Alexandrium_andersonii.AAC.1
MDGGVPRPPPPLRGPPLGLLPPAYPGAADGAADACPLRRAPDLGPSPPRGPGRRGRGPWLGCVRGLRARR